MPNLCLLIAKQAVSHFFNVVLQENIPMVAGCPVSISDGSDSNIDKNPISKKGKVSESSEEEREENGMMVNIIGARQTKASPEFVPKFGMNVNKNAERPTPPRKVVPDPVLTDEDSSQAEPTEPTSSWEIENRNKRMVN